MDGTPLDAEGYDHAWSEEWSDLKRYSPVGRHTRRWIVKLLKRVQFASIADFGCGEGSLLGHVQQTYPDAKISGADFSKVSVAKCIERLPGADIVVHDITDPSRPFTNVVDVGVCSEVIEHVEDDAAALTNLASWCRNIVITVPGGPLDDLAMRMGHLRQYTGEELRSKMEATGWEVQYLREWGFPFSYPLYARARSGAGYGAVTGTYSPLKRLVTHALYGVFFGNDLFSGGDKIFALARSTKIAQG